MHAHGFLERLLRFYCAKKNIRNGIRKKALIQSDQIKLILNSHLEFHFININFFGMPYALLRAMGINCYYKLTANNFSKGLSK
jgi:hypothetical protein|tara:strand:+ start:7624 stop:7872 length:249 start_codon:yes stop_codon:yes gene_type:complete